MMPSTDNRQQRQLASLPPASCPLPLATCLGQKLTTLAQGKNIKKNKKNCLNRKFAILVGTLDHKLHIFH